MSLFTRLSAAVKTFNSPINENVVKVVRSANPIDVQPGLTALESAIRADHLDKEHADSATFQITNLDGSVNFVSPQYICQGGQILTVIVNRDGKGI